MPNSPFSGNSNLKVEYRRTWLYPRFLQLLTDLEWAVEFEEGPRDEGWTEHRCPRCGGEEPRGRTSGWMGSPVGHELDCELAALLKECDGKLETIVARAIEAVSERGNA